MDAPMVQIVENHAEVSGELLSVTPDRERPGFVLLTVKIAQARPVGMSPNLFEQDVGRTLQIVARADSAAAQAKPGPISLRVKKTGPGMSFAE